MNPNDMRHQYQEMDARALWDLKKDSVVSSEFMKILDELRSGKPGANTDVNNAESSDIEYDPWYCTVISAAVTGILLGMAGAMKLHGEAFFVIPGIFGLAAFLSGLWAEKNSFKKVIYLVLTAVFIALVLAVEPPFFSRH